MTFPTEAEARGFLAQMQDTDNWKREAFAAPNVAVIPTTHGYWVLTSPSAAYQPATRCVICGEMFREYPCNPQPVWPSGACCAYCDDHVVTPARIREVAS
jgi:hypothetical protein